MDRRFITVLVVSLIFALVVSTVFYKVTSSSGSGPAKVEQTAMKEVVVAAKPLSVGVSIKPGDVRLQKVSGDVLPKGSFTKIDEVLERPIMSSILMDEPVLEGRLAARGSGLGLSPIIPVGMRAVTVRVNDVAGVAGFVLPGLRVDVLVTGRPPNQEGTVTNTCLQNMLVLSAGQTMQSDARGQAINSPSVTLLATPDQAEVLTLAGTQGSVQLVLRNGSDNAIEKTAGSSVGQLFGMKVKPVSTVERPRSRPKPVELAPVAPPPPPPPPPEVIMIRGNTKTVERVNQGASN